MEIVSTHNLLQTCRTLPSMIRIFLFSILQENNLIIENAGQLAHIDYQLTKVYDTAQEIEFVHTATEDIHFLCLLTSITLERTLREE